MKIIIWIYKISNRKMDFNLMKLKSKKEYIELKI